MKARGSVILLAFAGLISLRAAETPNSFASRGEQLARVYCQTCHLFPEASLLDKQTWINGALRRMSPLLGMTRIDLEHRPDGKFDRRVPDCLCDG